MKTLKQKLQALKMFSSRVVLMSINECIEHGIITQKQIEANWGGVRDYNYDRNDGCLVGVYYSRKEKTYKWEI